jgi:ABC-type glycerol-3-phosphate transport system substrate-binding protein
VSKKSKYINESWDFIQFIARADQAKLYTAKTERPAALRSLLNQQQENDELGVFAQQVLTAKSWYHGNDRAVMENAFKEMINAVLITGIDPIKAANLAAQKIQQTL